MPFSSSCYEYPGRFSLSDGGSGLVTLRRVSCGRKQKILLACLLTLVVIWDIAKIKEEFFSRS